MWGDINAILGHPNTKKNGITSLKVDNEIISKPEEIANCFNSYFSSIGQNLNSNFPDSTNYLDYLRRDSNIEFKFKSINESELQKIMLSLRGNNSDFNNNIPMNIFKDYFDILANIMTFICNHSIRTGVFPDKLYIAKVTCVYQNLATYLTCPTTVQSQSSRLLVKF